MSAEIVDLQKYRVQKERADKKPLSEQASARPDIPEVSPSDENLKGDDDTQGGSSV
ncbi:MAG: hypothetical protein HQ512_00245 [Rhodospirillales bacterium]|nr:hypothetical protein [Rhodospirillales bacterium]